MPPFGSPQFIVGALIAACAAALVTTHAERNHIKHPLAWGGAVFLFLIVALPLYVVHVRRVRRTRGRL